ncbi:MAG: carboxypeptidase regulatory-like domain-containing protein [Acidobacteria bacterium]|nr:carboxypeptidase regulatory-like domain-containing protein [Acidobacteriota bacterium]
MGNLPDLVLVRHDTERYKEGVRDFTLMGARQPLLDHCSTPATRRTSTRLAIAIFSTALLLAFGTHSASAQEPASQQAAGDPQPDGLPQITPPVTNNPTRSATGTICGSIIDVTGAPVIGAKITITRQDQSTEETYSDENGRFTLSNVKAGEFQLTISSPGFTSQGTSGLLHEGEKYSVPQVALTLATELTEVHVTMTQVEIAEAEIKEQEKQRVLGFVPNFYVSYVSDAAPLTAKQKFELAWKTTLDPVNFAMTGVIAGLEQSQDAFQGYGQGSQGYAKRFGAVYADGATATFIGGAILPSLFKQDPRYFYKGTGTRKSRALYALANAVICKGDNGKWQPAYSGILGSLAAGGISNLYYDKDDRGADLVLENTLIGIGASAVTNLLQEFVVKKLTPHAQNNPSVAAAP